MADPLPWPDLDPIPPGWLDDTPPEAVVYMRASTPQRRAATAHSLWRTGRAVVAAGERMRHPEASEKEIGERVRARFARAGTFG